MASYGLRSSLPVYVTADLHSAQLALHGQADSAVWFAFNAQTTAISVVFRVGVSFCEEPD